MTAWNMPVVTVSRIKERSREGARELDMPDTLDKLELDGLDNDLFDESAGYEDDTGIKLTKGLSDRDRRQATLIYRLFNGLWGLCIVRGDPGAGKDTFLNWFLYTCKRFFPEKKILRDEKPRKLFGPYAGLFNEERIKEDLDQMRKVAKGDRDDAGGGSSDGIYSAALEKAAEKWINSERAKVMLQGSVVGLTEYWKYVYNREPHKPINKTMGAIHKMGRHFDTLVVGNTQLESDLDKKTCKPFVNWRVTCTRSQRDPTRYTFILEKVKYDRRMDMIIPIGKPFAIPVDAGKPRSYIGDGKIVIKKPWYKPETPEEAIVMEAIKAGLDTYEGLVEFLEAAGDMSEYEVLSVLKDLCLNLMPRKRFKGILWYPCVYHIFNSKSAPNLRTSIKVGD